MRASRWASPLAPGLNTSMTCSLRFGLRFVFATLYCITSVYGCTSTFIDCNCVCFFHAVKQPLVSAHHVSHKKNIIRSTQTCSRLRGRLLGACLLLAAPSCRRLNGCSSTTILIAIVCVYFMSSVDFVNFGNVIKKLLNSIVSTSATTFVRGIMLIQTCDSVCDSMIVGRPCGSIVAELLS